MARKNLKIYTCELQTVQRFFLALFLELGCSEEDFLKLSSGEICTVAKDENQADKFIACHLSYLREKLIPEDNLDQSFDDMEIGDPNYEDDNLDSLENGGGIHVVDSDDGVAEYESESDDEEAFTIMEPVCLSKNQELNVESN